MAITGNLGAGKTLALTYFGLRNKIVKRRNVYANYHIKEPVNAVYIENPAEIDNIKEGVFLGDELWAWLDSRNFGRSSNKIGSKILLSSRKRGLHIFYTAQDISQIEKRIRIITDFEAVPLLIKKRGICIVEVWQLKFGKRVRFLQRFKFHVQPIYDMYDTNEEIDIKSF